MSKLKIKGFLYFPTELVPTCHTPSKWVTDQPHQVRVYRSVWVLIFPISLTCALPHSQAPTQLLAILGTRRLAGEHVFGVSTYARSPLYPNGWPYQNAYSGQYQRWIEKSWKCRGVNCSGLLSGRLPCHCHVQQSFNLVNVLISKFFTGQTNRLTDGQNHLLNPFVHARAG